MAMLMQNIPRNLSVMTPFVLLADLVDHEEKLLARMRPHESEIGAQIGQLLPRITGSTAEQRIFAIHHLVMGKRQNEFFRKRIKQAEGQILMVPASMRRIA